EAESFRRSLELGRGYIPQWADSMLERVKRLAEAGSFVDGMTACQGGTFLDEYWLAQCWDAGQLVALYQGTYDDGLVSLVRDELNARLAEMNVDAANAMQAMILRTHVEGMYRDATAPKQWRQYLDDGSYLKNESGEELSFQEYVDGYTLDADGFVSCTGDILTIEEAWAVETWNDLAERTRQTVASLAAWAADKPEDRSGFLAMAALYTDPEYDTAFTVGEIDLERKAWSDVMGEIAGEEAKRQAMKDEIARMGRSLDLKAGTGAEKALLAASDAVTALKNSYLEKQAELGAAAANIMDLGKAFDAAQDGVDASYKTLDDARLVLDKQTAIYEWAQTAYLGSGTVEDDLALPSTYRTPQQAYEYAQARLDRATTARQALSDVYDELEGRHNPEKAFQNALYTQYKESYATLARATKADALMKALMEREMQELAKNRDDYLKALSAMVKVNVGYGMDAEAIGDCIAEDGYTAGKAGLGSGYRYLFVEDGRLTFKYDADGKAQAWVGAPDEEERKAALADYLSKSDQQGATGERSKISKFELDARAWIATLRDKGDTNTTLQNYALAADYIGYRNGVKFGYSASSGTGLKLTEDTTVGAWIQQYLDAG
ncbi:MAG TPA: hypothetical protein PK625_07015, partial [Spirochaetales bacterium]|nr:hypothetical protein [Spirochaetales bacterium]